MVQATVSTTRARTSGLPSYRDPETVEAFWARVDTDGPLIASAPWLGPCWYWQGSTDRGYGVFRFRRRKWAAHRYAYMLTYGQPVFPVLDHLCDSYARCFGTRTCPHRLCVNPDHLESVSNSENLRRSHRPASLAYGGFRTAVRPVCVNGHRWSLALARYDSCGRRICGDCQDGLY